MAIFIVWVKKAVSELRESIPASFMFRLTTVIRLGNNNVI